MHFKAGRRVRGANQGHDYFVTFQWFATPRSSDMTEHAMLDLVPLTGPRWKVADFDFYAKLVCKSLQFVLPEPVARSVASSAVRRDENPANPERCANAGSGLPAGMSTPWLDSTWFPPMVPEVSFAVFAFDFRDYGESEKGLGSSSNWAKDAKAAFITAAGLEGVDTTRMAALGASIGADGAPDGCVLYNQEAGSGCVGAFSLSPGNYLGMDFAAVVRDLASTPVWCLAGELDSGSAPVCDGASGERYRSVVYPGIDLHGMRLITPDLEPQPLILTQDFLELVFGEIVK